MKITLTLDGSAHTGSYHAECQCGEHWLGKGEEIGAREWSPALAIAECVVHVRLAHNALPPDVQFSERFRAWLVLHWQTANARLAAKRQGNTFRQYQELVR